MPDATSPAVTPAVITASASILVAAAVFVGTLIVQFRNDRRQTALTRINTQLRDLYGPLYALVSINEAVWQSLRASRLPERDQRRTGTLTDEQAEEWQRWLRQALMPGNVRMRDVIILHADLLIGDSMPDVLEAFCSHVASYEVLLAPGTDQPKIHSRALIPHPGAPFAEYVRTSFIALKARQDHLLRGKQPKRD